MQLILTEVKAPAFTASINAKTDIEYFKPDTFSSTKINRSVEFLLRFRMLSGRILIAGSRFHSECAFTGKRLYAPESIVCPRGQIGFTTAAGRAAVGVLKCP